MSFAIVCGVLWIAAGGVSFLAYVNTKNMWILISASIYLIGYIIFVGLFAAVMLQINEYKNEFDEECPVVKKKLRRSSDEFMSYSICGFVLIGTSIIFTLASLVSI